MNFSEYLVMAPAACRKKTLLIVDDASFPVSGIAEGLLPYFEVRSARSGLEALEIARSSPCPDLILLDVALPDINGHGVMSRLKSDARTAGIPVIFVTAADAVDDIERGLCGGAVDYITRPLVVVDVIKRCRHVLAGASVA
jgi:putative two-component system response regulator